MLALPRLWGLVSDCGVNLGEKGILKEALEAKHNWQGLGSRKVKLLRSVHPRKQIQEPQHGDEAQVDFPDELSLCLRRPVGDGSAWHLGDCVHLPIVAERLFGLCHV